MDHDHDNHDHDNDDHDNDDHDHVNHHGDNNPPPANVYARLNFFPPHQNARLWLQIKRTAHRWYVNIASALLVALCILTTCALIAHPCAILFVHTRWPPPASLANRYRDDRYAALFVLQHGSALRALGTHLACHLELAQRLRSTYGFPRGVYYADKLTGVRDELQWPYISRMVREQADEALGLNASLASLAEQVDRQTWLLSRDWKTPKPWRMAKELIVADIATFCGWNSGSSIGNQSTQLGFMPSRLCRHVIPLSLQTPSSLSSSSSSSWSSSWFWEIRTQPHQHPALVAPVCNTARSTAISLREYLAIILRIRAIATHSGVSPAGPFSDAIRPTSPNSSSSYFAAASPPLPLRTNLRNIVSNISLDLLVLEGVTSTSSFVGRAFSEHIILRRKRKKALWARSTEPVQDAFIEFHTKEQVIAKIRLRPEYATVSKEVVEAWLDVRLLFGHLVSDIDQYDKHSLHLAYDILSNIKEVHSAMIAYGCPATTIADVWQTRTRYLPELNSVASLEHMLQAQTPPRRGQHHNNRDDYEAESVGHRNSNSNSNSSSREEEAADQIFGLRFTPNHLDVLQILQDVGRTIVVTDPAVLSPHQLAVREAFHSSGGGRDGNEQVKGKGKGKAKHEKGEEEGGADYAAECPRVRVTEV